MKNLFERSVAMLAACLLLAAPLSAQTANVQVIHNAAHPATAIVDVYVDDDLAIDNFAYRTATSFLPLPAGAEIRIGIADSASTSSADTLAAFSVTLQEAASYTLVVNGLLDPAAYLANPSGRDVSLDLLLRPMARSEATDPATVEFIAVHGVTDAPVVDVVARGVGTLVRGVAYGDVTDYAAVPADTYILDVQPGADPSIWASFDADLSGLAGSAVVLVASGFFAPFSNQSGPDLALLAVLPDGTAFSLPRSETPAFARIQIIHNAADPSAAVVDVYVDENLTVDDFAFQTATPFTDLPAGRRVSIGIAGAESTSSSDIISINNVTLFAAGTYLAVANGVLNAADFAANPDFRQTSLDLFLMPTAREVAEDPAMVDVVVMHGVTDAPAVDVLARGATTLASSLFYGTFSDYVSVPPAPYVVDVTLPGGSPIVASFGADLSDMAGEAVVILASGFLSPPDNQNGPGLGAVAVRPFGEALVPPVVTGAEAAAEIPTRFRVQGNYPNPFNPSTRIVFDLPEPAAVGIEVFDMLGRRVMAIPAGEYRAGTGRSASLDASALTSGWYVYELSADTGNDVLAGRGIMAVVK